MKKQTLRQAIIESAARTFRNEAVVTTSKMGDWMHSGAAAFVAHDYGMDHDGLHDAVDGMNFLLLTAAVDREVQREQKQTAWISALRGRP